MSAQRIARRNARRAGTSFTDTLLLPGGGELISGHAWDGAKELRPQGASCIGMRIWFHHRDDGPHEEDLYECMTCGVAVIRADVMTVSPFTRGPEPAPQPQRKEEA